MKRLKLFAVALGVVAINGSALGALTLTVSDGLNTASVAGSDGSVYYGGPLDSLWNVTIASGETKPAIGTASSPEFELAVTAQSTSQGGNAPANNLVITVSDNGFGPTDGSFQGILTGQVVSGTGQNVSYNTYYDAGDITGATTTLLTTIGPLPGGPASGPVFYNGTATGGPVNQTLYSITQVLTIGVNAPNDPGGSYSLDASLSVPEPTTIVTSALLLLPFGASALRSLRKRQQA